MKRDIYKTAQFSHFSTKTVPLPAQSSATAVGELCYCGGRTLPAQSENFATATAELCHGSGRTLRRQSDNFATAAAELCCGFPKIAFLCFYPLKFSLTSNEVEPSET